MYKSSVNTCEYVYVCVGGWVCTGLHHVTTQQGIIRAYHEAYTVELIRGPPHKAVREQSRAPINQEADVGLKKIPPSKITRAAPPPPPSEGTISQDGKKATPELQALLRAIASLAPELESPTTAQEALPFVLQVVVCQRHLYLASAVNESLFMWARDRAHACICIISLAPSCQLAS